ncbi:MAG: D-alanyl-D-alanine dipeptidase [Bacteroidales bacterium]|nr:D-alanyl-D-alanine dipeptidase [Bacteroidales bacterium]
MRTLTTLLLLAICTLKAGAQPPLEGFLRIQDLDNTIAVDLMYAKSDNFVGEVMYDFTEAYLHPKAAHAVVEANRLLSQAHPGWRLCIYDATRPMRVQQIMWDKVKGTPQQNYVSNPARGGGLHNYGLAVDVSIIDEKGDSIDMGTKVDALTPLSHTDREEELVRQGKISREAMENRRLLRRVMTEAGFKPLRSEWWHFNFTTRADARANYRVVE